VENIARNKATAKRNTKKAEENKGDRGVELVAAC
jgi:hypothetical protein